MSLLLVPLAYLLGSIPFGWIFTKVLKGEDIRKSGSGATGGTNTIRKLGPYWGALVVTADVSKAFLPTYFAVKKEPENRVLHLAVATAASMGHTNPVVLKHGGGKAVSTTAGSFFAIACKEKSIWQVVEFAVAAFIGALIGGRRVVSVASLTGVSAGSFYATRMVIQRKISVWYWLGILGATVNIFIMHRENIKRLGRREEPQTNFKFW